MERQVSNRYRLIEPLGEGGMGVVWRAYDELLDRTVAIKEVRYTGIGDAKRSELNSRTIREARAAGRLDHPSVVVIHDVIEEDGRPWIVMQLVRSRSLAEVIREQGPLPVGQAALIGSRVLDALRAAHATGVLHRDVKPENVLLADDGRVVLTDFGIAALEAEAGLTATGGLVGTPAYMPPERLNGEPARPESDLWSLGATLYTAVEGEPPFRRDSWAATVAAVLRDEPRPPARAGALKPLIMGLLRRDPAARIPAEQAAEVLRAVAAEPSRTVPLQAPRPARRRSGKWPAVVGGLAVVAALGAGGVALVNQQRHTTPTPTPTPTATATTSATRTPTKSPKPTATPLPAGWRLLTNDEGRFSIGIPQGWQATKNPRRAQISVKGSGSPGTLIVEWTAPENGWTNAVDHWRDVERQIKAQGTVDYTRLGITPVRYLGMQAADWEFTRRNSTGTLIHVLNRGFRTGDGRTYAVYWETPDSDWDANQHYFDTFTETFRPR
ncbi:serine/threonine-protein kinase [Nonomuraea sediminis]|uniref:serine/threonine-protein kinase n=1 Tax=Nonomuraea sediminis TaxID=2835864 RepID=UPI001BDC30E0|nr:serine/threonine-protein kinase [Nonomuraea sediminis]